VRPRLVAAGTGPDVRSRPSWWWPRRHPTTSSGGRLAWLRGKGPETRPAGAGRWYGRAGFWPAGGRPPPDRSRGT